MSTFAASQSATAAAHFVVVSPPANLEQGILGDPQKEPPCGGAGTATNKITGFKPGETVTIKINETVPHPGHYRISIAESPDQLPEEPPVTAGSTPCGSAPIMDPPVYPVLADGLLVHTSPLSGTQTMTVTLPSNLTCTKCTLQIIEFMSDHGLNQPGGCYYHHCLDISITGDGETPPATPTADAGALPPAKKDAGADTSDTGDDGEASDDQHEHESADASSSSASVKKDAGSKTVLKDAGTNSSQEPGAGGDDSGGCAVVTGAPNIGGASGWTLGLLGLLVSRRKSRRA